MDNAPQVSVIMPVYNGAEFLSDAIESIINQTFTDWELIIVNDGSTDSSPGIMDRFALKDSRIKPVNNSENLGIARSLNNGLDIARGKYIARMDDEDISYPQRLEKQVEFLNERPDIGVCGTAKRIITPHSVSAQAITTLPDEIYAAMLFGNQICHCSVMFRRKLFLENGWKYSTRFLLEDYELWARIIPFTRFANLNEVLLDIRWGWGNISVERSGVFSEESRKIISGLLSKHLDIDVSKYDRMLLSSWADSIEPYASVQAGDFIISGHEFISEIRRQNDKLNIFNKCALEKTLKKRWQWILKNSCVKGFIGFPENIKEADVDILPRDMQPIIKKGAKVIVYGLGASCEKFFTDYSHIGIDNFAFNIIAFCDKNNEKQGNVKFNRDVIRPNQIGKYKYEYIVVASDIYFEEICDELIRNHDIPKTKILPIAAMYAAQVKM